MRVIFSPLFVVLCYEILITMAELLDDRHILWKYDIS